MHSTSSCTIPAGHAVPAVQCGNGGSAPADATASGRQLGCARRECRARDERENPRYHEKHLVPVELMPASWTTEFRRKFEARRIVSVTAACRGGVIFSATIRIHREQTPLPLIDAANHTIPIGRAPQYDYTGFDSRFLHGAWPFATLHYPLSYVERDGA